MLDGCVDGLVGRGDVLLGEFAAGVGDGATEGDLDHPAGVDSTVGPVVSFAVTSLECDEVGWTAGRTIIRNVRLHKENKATYGSLTSWSTHFCIRRSQRIASWRTRCGVLLKKLFVDIYGAIAFRMWCGWC